MWEGLLNLLKCESVGSLRGYLEKRPFYLINGWGRRRDFTPSGVHILLMRAIDKILAGEKINYTQYQLTLQVHGADNRAFAVLLRLMELSLGVEDL